MDDGPVFRPAGQADLPALLDLYQHLNPGDARPDASAAGAVLDRLAALPGSAILVAQVGRVLAASCTLVVVPNLTRGGRPFGLIENVVTHADFRRRGLGRQLLDLACAAGWDAGCYKIMLMTGSTRPGTLKFYRDAGFEASKTGFQKRRIAARSEEGDSA